MTNSGYADVVLVGITDDSSFQSNLSALNKTRLSYYPCNIDSQLSTSKPIEIPASDITFGHWNSIEDCHVLITTVNSRDNKECCTRLKNMKEMMINKKIVVFSMQRGVGNCNLLKDTFGGKGILIIDCVLGYAVVPHNKNPSAYTSTVKNPMLVMERLSKENEALGNGPMNLIEHMGMYVYYKKTLTPCSWGVLMYDNLYALNALTGGTMSATMSNYQYRLVYASMLRECRKALQAASRGGGWKPDISLISSYLTPLMFELILVLPNVLFYLVIYMLDLMPVSLASPMQIDLLEGRFTVATENLTELINTGKRYGSSMAVCAAVLAKIQEIETIPSAVSRHDVINRSNRSNMEYLYKAMFYNEKNEKIALHASIHELLYWLVQTVTALSLLMLLYYLLVHDT